MTQPFFGEIKLFAGNFAPAGWMSCEGQLLLISEHDTLFALIGTTYGGNGQTTFALPDLRGRVVIHRGTQQGVTFNLAQTGGVETVTLTVNQMPSHSAGLVGQQSAADSQVPTGHVLAIPADPIYAAYTGNAADLVPLQGGTLVGGGSQPHENMPPFVVMHHIISLSGIFPSQT